jgi:hypothetical protein
VYTREERVNALKVEEVAYASIKEERLVVFNAVVVAFACTNVEKINAKTVEARPYAFI